MTNFRKDKELIIEFLSNLISEKFLTAETLKKYNYIHSEIWIIYYCCKNSPAHTQFSNNESRKVPPTYLTNSTWTVYYSILN